MTRIAHIKQCVAVKNTSTYLISYNNNSAYYRETEGQLAQKALLKLEEALAKDEQTHQENISGLENNKALQQEAINFMENQVGISKTKRIKDPKSRARIPKMITVNNGWYKDILENVVVNDGYDFVQKDYEKKKKLFQDIIEKYTRDAERAKAEKKAEEEAAVAHKKSLMDMVAIINRYDELDETYEWEDILEYLLKKSRLLNLAHAMSETRGDWNEGPYRVKNALFEPTNDVEKLILEDISRITYDWDGDGRVYRDCKYNYGVLFNMLDQTDHQLMIDYYTAVNYIPRW